MNLMNKIREKAAANAQHGAVTIAFLGDSVTQGCFELYRKPDNAIDTVFDKEHAYHRYLDQIFTLLFPSVSVNIVNAGVSGGMAPHGLDRLDRDVISKNPDLTVVCFGLNDTLYGMDGLEDYKTALREIFRRLKEAGSEVIFMTPNMMNTYVSKEITDQDIITIAEAKLVTQTGGVMDTFIEEARLVCEEAGVKVCDCYAKWKRLSANGVDTTRLLANRINHPCREMNWLFAVSLLDAILDD